VRTVGSYWPPATAFGYIRRAMPVVAPQSLTNDGVRAHGVPAVVDGVFPTTP
jgi:cytochrome c